MVSKENINIMEYQNRSPVCCILGHVDVGKTRLLDKMRESHIQDKEVGGITQQIGATYFSKEALTRMTTGLNCGVEIAGLLMIDTPGHDCFSQMRTIGVKVCHLAIVVVDLIKGLEKQTIQCIELLKSTKTPFIIALNKLDKIDGWKKTNLLSLNSCLKEQSKHATERLKQYTNKIIAQLAKLEINGLLYYENKNVDEFISMVPVSALTNEGLADLIVLISKLTTRNFKKTLNDNPLFKYTHGYIIDLKKEEKLGTIYYTILMNGKLKKGDVMLLEKNDGTPIQTKIKDIFIPEDETEMKNKPILKPISDIAGTCGVALKLVDDIENDVSLGGLLLSNQEPSIATDLFAKYCSSGHFSDKDFTYDKNGIIINVPAKSMADAVVQIFKSEPNNSIKISNIHVGKINKVLIIKASNANTAEKGTFEHEYSKRYSVILNYDTNYQSDDVFDDEILNMANSTNVKIISDNIIYKLFDKYKQYIALIDQTLRKQHSNIIKPFELQVLPKYIFRKKSPLIIGTKILQGTIMINNYIEAKNGTNRLILGKITGIQKNEKPLDKATKGDEVCLKIEQENSQIEYGRQFDHTWELHNYMSTEDQLLSGKYPDVFNI